MRPLGLFVMFAFVTACTTTPMFPPEFMRDIKTDDVALKAWRAQTPYPSGARFVSHTVQLGGVITQVIRKTGGAVIIVEEQPIDKYLGYGPTSVRREGSFEFAIVLPAFPDADMLQPGNQLAVVGAMDSPSSEVVGWMPRVLPHVLAQCLHVWKTEGVETDNVSYEGSMGYYPLENRTFCREEGKGETLSSGDGERNATKGSTGS